MKVIKNILAIIIHILVLPVLCICWVVGKIRRIK